MSLVSRVQQQAAQNPTKAAYSFMGKETSYAEFEGTVAKFAGALQTLGVKKGDNVAFLLGNTPHFLISLYATMRIGATAVPINPIYTPDEISYIIKNSDAKVVIALDLLLPLVEQAAGAFPKVVSRERLLEELWDDQSFVDENTLNVNMTRVRKKLTDYGVKSTIETVRGAGYRLLLHPEEE